MLGPHVGDCQNDGPFLGPYYNTGPNTGPNLGDPKRDHNFDNPPCVLNFGAFLGLGGLGFEGLWRELSAGAVFFKKRFHSNR